LLLLGAVYVVEAVLRAVGVGDALGRAGARATLARGLVLAAPPVLPVLSAVRIYYVLRRTRTRLAVCPGTLSSVGSVLAVLGTVGVNVAF